MGVQAEIPAPLVVAFSERVSLPLRDTARLLSMDESTLRAHVLAGNIRFIRTGLGIKSIRREFRLSDVLEFLEKMSRVECPSTSVKTRRITTTTSNSEVIGFTALRAKLIAEKQRKRKA